MSGEMTEFRITSDLSALRGQIIEANFDEVRAWLDENLAPYREMAVTSDTMSTAKQYRANIRKVRDRIDESRKEAKNAALSAYSAFEAKCKELTGLCDDAANAIDGQVKALEEAEASEKIDLLLSEYDAIADGEIQEYLPWGCINNPKWRNKSYSFDTACSEIRNAVDNCRNDLATIRSMGGDDTPYLLDVYRQTRNLSAVVKKASDLKTMRQREEQRAREEALRREEKERERIAASPQAAPRNDDLEAKAMQKAAESAHAPVIENKAEAMCCVTFRVNCTPKQLIALGNYMKENGIRYCKA